MTVEREVLNTDILIVGAGPAGLALAYKLAKIAESDSEFKMPEILLMEKGSYVGAHSLSGAVMDPKGIEEHDRVGRLERAIPPGSHFLVHRIGDRRDQVR